MQSEWYSDELRAAKRDRRKAERRMRKSNLTVHREMFRDTWLYSFTIFTTDPSRFWAILLLFRS
jgi:hypothetical protein